MKTKTREWYGEPYNAWYDGEVKQLHRAGKVVIKYPGLRLPRPGDAPRAARPLRYLGSRWPVIQAWDLGFLSLLLP